MRHWVWPALVAIFSLHWMPSAAAVEGRYALIVGIGNYSEASRTEPLKGIPKDVDNARRMALSMGVDPRSIVEIRDAQATKGRVLRELERLRKLVKPGDRVLVYWSGHGARYAGPKGCVEGLQTYTEGPFTEDDVLSEAELEAAIAEHNRNYWELNEPEITDAEFDLLVRELTARNPNSPVLARVPTSTITGDKVRHGAPMLSLDKCYSAEELDRWFARIEGAAIATQKIDGLAVSLRYDGSGRLMLAATRGDGETGELVTANMLMMGQVRNGTVTFAYPEDARRNLIVQRKQ